ncbi:MAG: Asp23/Gls24 family envelope stress response protein [Planctomycetota bacterium]|nr:Asp23/Gls24 family envelope stress response protein [Planctomycetota bacterium]
MTDERRETIGRVEVSDRVYSEIARREAQKVRGVVGLQGSFVEALTGRARGIQVDRTGHDVSVELRLCVEYGVNIPALAAEVRERVASAIRQMTGMRVRAVNIHVDAIAEPGDGGDAQGDNG